MTDENEDEPCCLNCQSVLYGPFCGHCGQAHSERLVPVKVWVSDFFGSFFKLDSKLLRTTKDVLFQPGKATVDFGLGRRMPYASPAKVYIVVSAISIALMTLQGSFSQGLAVPGLNADADFQKRVQFLFPFVNLLSPFVTVAFLAMLQPHFFVQLHLAFSLHFWAFFIAASTPVIFIPPTSVWMLVALIVLAAAICSYLVLAHRRVYVIPPAYRVFSCGMILLSLPFATMVFGFLLFFMASMIP